jgi:hypothetical protein
VTNGNKSISSMSLREIAVPFGDTARACGTGRALARHHAHYGAIEEPCINR